MKRAFLVIVCCAVVLVGSAYAYFEYSVRRWVDFGGRRNVLTCELRSADGARIEDIELGFYAGDEFRMIPLAALGGGQPDKVIRRSYSVHGSAPGQIRIEWPQLFLSLRTVKCGGQEVPLDRDGEYIAHWDNHVFHFFPDGSPDWKDKIPGIYRAVVVIDRVN